MRKKKYNLIAAQRRRVARCHFVFNRPNYGEVFDPRTQLYTYHEYLSVIGYNNIIYVLRVYAYRISLSRLSARTISGCGPCIRITRYYFFFPFFIRINIYYIGSFRLIFIRIVVFREEKKNKNIAGYTLIRLRSMKDIRHDVHIYISYNIIYVHFIYFMKNTISIYITTFNSFFSRTIFQINLRGIFCCFLIVHCYLRT